MAGRWAPVVGVLLLLPLLPLASSSMVFKRDGNVYPSGYAHDLLSTSSISLCCGPKRCQKEKVIISVFSPYHHAKDWSLFFAISTDLRNATIWPLFDTFSVAAQPLLYVTMNIGEPAKHYFLDIDTGSNLTWLECNTLGKGACLTCNKVR
jgi:hypothetical protein